MTCGGCGREVGAVFLLSRPAANGAERGCYWCQMDQDGRKFRVVEIVLGHAPGKHGKITRAFAAKKSGQYADTTTWPGHTIPVGRREMTRKTIRMGA